MKRWANDFRAEYYEQQAHWNQGYHLSPAERERASASVANVPSDVRSILDVGCGSGVFLHALQAEYPARFPTLVGIDRFREPLTHVRQPKACADISLLPFRDKAFDLVCSLEVLEHVTYPCFSIALQEIQRVSRKYILISIPNSQNLDHFLVVCPECRCHFNPYLHVRSFSEASLSSLFEDFELMRVAEVGPLVITNAVDSLIAYAARITGKCIPPARCICPQCGYRNGQKLTIDIDSSPRRGKKWGIAASLKYISRLCLPTKKRKGWLLGLYSRKY